MISKNPERLFERQGGPRSNDRTSDARGSYDEKLNRILHDATQLFARVGYAKATMRGIAKATGVSLAGLYHYFDSKEKMLFLIQFRAFTALLNNLREKLHGVDDPVEQLRVMVKSHVAYFAANMAALKVCSHELDSLSGAAFEETRAIRHSYYQLARSVVDRAVAQHAPECTFDLHVATMSLFGTLNWLYRWYDPRHGKSPTVLANQIADQFLTGVLHTPGAIERVSPADDAP